MLPAPPQTPLDHDVILPSPPPTYEEAVSSTQPANVIDLISDDEGDGGDYDDDDDCVFVN